MKIVIVALLLLAACGSVEASEPDTIEEFNRFRLFNNCTGMPLVIEELPEDASDIRLTKDAISAAVESRLRGARIYSDSSFKDYLYININVAGQAFSISAEFKKVVYDVQSETSLFATTWDKGLTGTHGKDSGYILSALSGLMDQFILEYLKINEEACQ